MRATCGRFGTRYPLRSYDDAGEGNRMFVYVETLGPVGIVRARSWEDAYSVCEDVIFDDADPDDPDTYARSYDENAEEGELAECHGYRNNGPAGENGLTSYLYQTDHNGSYLYDVRSAEGRRIVREWGIRWDFQDAALPAADGGR